MRLAEAEARKAPTSAEAENRRSEIDMFGIRRLKIDREIVPIGYDLFCARMAADTKGAQHMPPFSQISAGGAGLSPAVDLCGQLVLYRENSLRFDPREYMLVQKPLD